jgi:hypothetical protein
MLTCLPKSLCSWDYLIRGAASGSADVTFNFFSEQGTISLGGVSFVIAKDGPFSGHWTLCRGGETLAAASKPNPFVRSFLVTAGDLRLTVEAEVTFARGFVMIANGDVVGSIRPVHAFTRRAYIECCDALPEFIQLFAFWLAALTWRRAASQGAGG